MQLLAKIRKKIGTPGVRLGASQALPSSFFTLVLVGLADSSATLNVQHDSLAQVLVDPIAERVCTVNGSEK